MFTLQAKNTSPWNTPWTRQYLGFQKRYPLETVHGVVLFSNLEHISAHIRTTVSFSGLGQSRTEGIWSFSPERLILKFQGQTYNWANLDLLTVIYDQSDPEKDLLTVLDQDGDTLLEVDFSVHIKNKIKVAGGFLMASGFRAHEITPETLQTHDDLLEDYFKRAREPQSRYFQEGTWVGTSVPPLPEVEH
ncbi:hypothetical protein [Deinococcus roseus]|uniref:DUF402 domain-containing protein n=1 Tax=Deinococcus roseus TaxID=392414 RepID=A0ABQ2CXA8_9DEIO|nr:hypothetical protein [Deinococcus roseus]GGJ30387.1 hypothetical protein GCM10008938_15520 [Deinococcus roseus]